MKAVGIIIALLYPLLAYGQDKFEKIKHIERVVYINDTIYSHISMNTLGEWVPIQDSVILFFISKNDTVSFFDKYLVYYITFENDKLIMLRLNKPFNAIDNFLAWHDHDDSTLDFDFWYKEGEYEIIIKGHDDW